MDSWGFWPILIDYCITFINFSTVFWSILEDSWRFSRILAKFDWLLHRKYQIFDIFLWILEDSWGFKPILINYCLMIINISTFFMDSWRFLRMLAKFDWLLHKNLQYFNIFYGFLEILDDSSQIWLIIAW